MKLRSIRSFTSVSSLAASLLIAAAAVPAADSVATRENGAKLVTVQLPQVSQVSPLRVHRGSASETVAFVASPEAVVPEVLVLRGTTEPEEPPAPRLPAPRLPTAQLSASSGRDLWFYDPEGETLRACRLFKASVVGRYKIRCFERRLH
ncbi:MAG: hypothetical protein MI785_20830 [Kiloniellales bacterium]|nr:hypothetical protein [Kiloniellales bacterium]